MASRAVDYDGTGAMRRASWWPLVALLLGSVTVLGCTWGMPASDAHLSLLVSGNVWRAIAIVFSARFADTNHWLLWSVVGTVDELMFFTVSVPVYFVLRRRAPWTVVAIITLWTVGLSLALLVLFPLSVLYYY